LSAIGIFRTNDGLHVLKLPLITFLFGSSLPLAILLFASRITRYLPLSSLKICTERGRFVNIIGSLLSRETLLCSSSEVLFLNRILPFFTN